ncbi:MAG: 2Fe-2S iron-sulfur cluster-binding protein [Pseudomonadota bacterium]
MNVTWIQPDGSRHTEMVEAGMSLMDAAVQAGVDGIDGDCGGCLSCATCHVYVDDAWAEKTGEADVMEEGMLEVVEAERTPRSRLSCQITMSAELDGLVLHVPPLD